MGYPTTQAKLEILKCIEAALPQYSRYRNDKGQVDVILRMYLEELEHSIDGYKDALPEPDQTIIEYYLHGYDIPKILSMVNVRKKLVDLVRVREVIAGTEEKAGLINTMFTIFVHRPPFCPFCHTKHRSGGMPMPKVTGNVCDHMERWDKERGVETA